MDGEPDFKSGVISGPFPAAPGEGEWRQAPHAERIAALEAHIAPLWQRVAGAEAQIAKLKLVVGALAFCVPVLAAAIVLISTALAVR